MATKAIDVIRQLTEKIDPETPCLDGLVCRGTNWGIILIRLTADSPPVARLVPQKQAVGPHGVQGQVVLFLEEVPCGVPKDISLARRYPTCWPVDGQCGNPTRVGIALARGGNSSPRVWLLLPVCGNCVEKSFEEDGE
jgi:hypothetical protein